MVHRTSPDAGALEAFGAEMRLDRRRRDLSVVEAGEIVGHKPQ
jgi:hypothetical protein